MKTFKSHLKEKLKNKKFRVHYKEAKKILEIAFKVVEAREKLGMTQKSLAKKAHITQQQLSKIENGINCNMITFLKVCQALDMQIKLSYKIAS